MLYTIVIPTYKRPKALGDCLDCLTHYFTPKFKQILGFCVEVIVSDDGHEDSLKNFLLRHYQWCLYIKGPQRGPAANRNHGANQARGDWLVFTDDDCLPQPGWLESYAASADKCSFMEGRTSAVGHRTRMDEECPINESGGFLWSCNFAIKREAFLKLGGFNEDFPAAAMEDVELNARVKQAGLRVNFVAGAVVFHPWRIRKGRSYVRVQALSVARYVYLHPDSADHFLAIRHSKNVIKAFTQNIGEAIVKCNWNGLVRQIFLACYANYFTWMEVRRVRRAQSCRSSTPGLPSSGRSD